MEKIKLGDYMSAIYNLFDEIIAFVKALFKKEVGNDIEKELEDAFNSIA